MATPSEITPLIALAWEKDPDQNFFEFLYEVFQTNETLFSLGELTNDKILDSFEQYLSGAAEDTPETPDSVEDPVG